MRAARHYEAAAAKLISRCVETATAFIAFNSCEPAPVGQWVVTSAPARIDLAGGWTDTPPVSYEYGGVVVNCAILVDGKRALEARVRRIAEPVIRLRYDGQDDCTECRLCADMADYSHPLAAAALLKTAILCIGLVDLDAAEELPEQLERTLGESKRLVVESPWSQFDIECQRV
jgi:fucokinase